MNAPPPNPNANPGPSTAKDGKSINPITGTTAEKQTSSVDDMTEEEKEREMEKLFVLFDRLEKTGALPESQNPVRKAMQKANEAGASS